MSAQANDTAIANLTTQVVRLVKPLRIIAFGSAARGQAGPDSDIDLLVVMPDGTSRRKTSQLLYEKITGLGLSFDIVVATPNDLQRHKDNPGLIYKKVLSEGKELYAAGATSSR